MAGAAWTSHSSVVSADVASDHRFLDPTLRQLGVVAALMVPVKVGQQPHQLIGLLRRRDGAFTAEEVALVESIAQPLACRTERWPAGDHVPPTAWPARESEVADPTMQLATTPAIQDTLSQLQADRRVSPRHDFRRQQWIGPIACGVLPRREDYFAVECVDISTGGFAFYLDRTPSFNSLIVILDMHHPPLYVAARVVHLRKPSHRPNLFEVGCQFIVRL
jgi:hypothetical protein